MQEAAQAFRSIAGKQQCAGASCRARALHAVFLMTMRAALLQVAETWRPALLYGPHRDPSEEAAHGGSLCFTHFQRTVGCAERRTPVQP